MFSRGTGVAARFRRGRRVVYIGTTVRVLVTRTLGLPRRRHVWRANLVRTYTVLPFVLYFCDCVFWQEVIQE